MEVAATATQINSILLSVLGTTSLSSLKKTPIAHYQVKPMYFKSDEVNTGGTFCLVFLGVQSVMVSNILVTTYIYPVLK